MKYKKIVTIMAGLALMGPLAACGNRVMATTSGGKITQDQYYKKLKQSSAGQEVMQQMILDQVLEKQYGKQVTDKKVNAQFNSYKDSYGAAFNTMLQQNGMTAQSFKDRLKSQMLMEAAVRADSKFTKKALAKQWKEFQPKVSTAMIVVNSQSDAQSIIDEVNGASNKLSAFKKLAKSKSIDDSTAANGGVMPAFDNTNSTLPEDVRKAVFELQNGEVTAEPIETENGYYVVYMIKHPGKGTYKQHVNDLKDQIVTKNMNNQAFAKKVVAKALKNGNVSIKDNDLKGILSGYLTPTTTNNK